MTDEQKYDELLKEIGQILKQKNDDIYFLEYEVKDLKKKLYEAEKQLEDHKAE